MCEDDLAHLHRRHIARGSAFIEERDIERAGTDLQFADRVEEQVTKFLSGNACASAILMRYILPSKLISRSSTHRRLMRWP